MKLEKGNPSNNLYYDNYLVRKVENKPSKKRQLWILDNHPAFTGICSNCGFEYEKSLLILDVDNKSHHWNCPQCGLSYD